MKNNLIIFSFFLITAHFVATAQTKRNPAKTSQDSITLAHKIGQMIMVGINERKVIEPNDPLLDEIKLGIAGNIILFEKNIALQQSRETLIQLTQDLKKYAPTPLFISIDEEGGKVHRLKEKYGFVSMPSAQALGALQNTDSTYYYARRLATQLQELGINANFAPVVDVNLNNDNPIIAKVGRAYSSEANEVTAQASTFIKAHHDSQVFTTLKHFPGHGSSSADTHKGLVDVTQQWQEQELIPYKNLIDAQLCDAIVSCHVINCKLDTTCLPATLSKVITTQLLRNHLGFKGVVFSDDMQMYAISKNYGLEKSVEMAINAGVDILVFGNNVNSTDRNTATQVHQVITKLVKEQKISPTRIDEAYQRIMLLKNKNW